LLSYDFYEENQSNLTRNLFEDEYRELYDEIVSAHKQYGDNLTPDDVHALWMKSHPVATKAEESEISNLIKDIKETETLSHKVSLDVLKSLWKQHIGHKVANLGVEISRGVEGSMERLSQLVENTAEGFLPTDFDPDITTDIEELLLADADSMKWEFNIETLSRHVRGIGPGKFGCVFAVPETGKTAFAISVCFGPRGFAQQGAKVAYITNEEEGKTTMLRAQQCMAGSTKEEVIRNPKATADVFRPYLNQIFMQNAQGWDLSQLDAYLTMKKPDVVVLDQGDKINVTGSFNAGHEKLRALFIQLRELAKKHECAILTVSQASADARGRTRLSQFDMEGSKIGKAAETDLIIGIGRHEPGEVDDSEPDHTRYLTVSKNKLSGWHGTVICNIEPAINRYVV
jgi:archaellum biogenesis ATPase FlaH